MDVAVVILSTRRQHPTIYHRKASVPDNIITVEVFVFKVRRLRVSEVKCWVEVCLGKYEKRAVPKYYNVCRCNVYYIIYVCYYMYVYYNVC